MRGCVLFYEAMITDDGELDYSTIKDHVRDVRRTMRKANHFSRQEQPLERARPHAREAAENLMTLQSFQRGLKKGDWSKLSPDAESVTRALQPFLTFYRPHGKLPDITNEQALCFVIYRGVVDGCFDIGDDLQLSTDTPRGFYPHNS